MRTSVASRAVLIVAATLSAAGNAAAADKKTCQDWVTALKEPSRRAATLEELGPAAKAKNVPWCAAMVPLFVEALGDADGDTRFRAALSLQRLAASSAARAADLRPHLEAIVAAKDRLKKGESPFTSTALLEAIGHLGAPAVPHLVAEVKQDAQGLYGFKAAVVLGQIGPAAAAALPALEAAFAETSDNYSRDELEKAIRAIRGK